MTREEAYKTIKENLCAMCAYGSQCMESCDIRSCDNRDAIKALEQEPVLDKLRAEIVELTKCPYGTECLGANCPSNIDCMICGDHVLEIIDKYKAESEEDIKNV